MKIGIWLILLCVIELGSCTAKQTSLAPQQTGDGWQTASPAEVGLDEQQLREAVERIQDKTYRDVDSLLIVKDGKLVFEVYFDGHEWNYDSPQFQGEEETMTDTTTSAWPTIFPTRVAGARPRACSKRRVGIRR